MHTPWNLVEALEFVQELSPIAARAGYALALAGSVLTKGRSRKDLDLIVFPLRTDKAREYQLREALIVEMSMKLVFDEAFVKAQWKAKSNSDDEKRVEVWEWLGKRIDIFYLR
jgi:hypothetical protein